MERARGRGTRGGRADRRARPAGVPVRRSPAAGPAFFRRGGPEELQRRIDAGELVPDFGPARLDAAAGAVLVGARRPLIAFNVNLRRDDVEVARAIAARRARDAAAAFPACGRSGSTCRAPASSR